MAQIVGLLISLVIAGCAKSAVPPSPVDISFGDCAPSTTTFVVGPVPQAFTPESIGREDTLYASRGAQADVLAGLANPRDDEARLSERAVDLRFQTRYQDLKPPARASSGYGISSRRAAYDPDVPVSKMGEVVTDSDLPPTILRRYLKRNYQRIHYCYEKALVVMPRLGGTVKVAFDIDAQGSVVHSSAAGVDPDAAQCIADVVMKIEFPKSPAGKGGHSTSAFEFRPSAKQAGSPTARADKQVMIGKAPPPPAPVEHRAAPRAAIFGLAHVDGQPAGSADATYQPGTATPLLPLRDSLAACWRRQRATSGSLVIELGNGAPVVYGFTDSAFQGCVAKLDAKLAGVAPQRCAIAFGRVVVADARGIDVAEQSVTIDQQKLPVVHTMGDPWWRLSAVVDLVRVRSLAALERREVVTTLGPLVIRPLPTTTMGVVSQVLHSAMVAGGDPILAALRGAEWKLLRDRRLPAVPTPLGTGGSFSDDMISQRNDSERAQLSILVGKDRTVVSFSRDDDLANVPLADAAGLEQALRSRKTSPVLAARTDIELAAEDDSTYERVVEVIDLLDRVGFTDWTLTSRIASGAIVP